MNERTARRAFTKQRATAKLRGIAWELSFTQWLEFWGDKLSLRGRSPDSLVMARLGDEGPYREGNIEMISMRKNCGDARRNSHRRGIKPSRLGKGKGWTFVARAPERPYQVTVAKQYVGSFATEDEANEAYMAAVVSLRMSRREGFAGDSRGIGACPTSA